MGLFSKGLHGFLLIDLKRSDSMRQSGLMKHVRDFLKLYRTKDCYYYGHPDRLQLALITLLKDSYTESKIKSAHSQYVRDIKKKVTFVNASKSFFAYLDKENSPRHLSDVPSKKKPIKKDMHSVRNRQTKKYKKK